MYVFDETYFLLYIRVILNYVILLSVFKTLVINANLPVELES
jgi:hypothetical protein